MLAASGWLLRAVGVVFSDIPTLGDFSVPKFEDTEATGREGVHAVGLALSKMKWVFREQPTPDTGIDGQIETRDQENHATGRLIGCQIKSGPSFFEEETPSGIVYRGKPEHLSYWKGHSLPVIVILCDEANVCYWQVVNDKTAISTGKGWKIEVPKEQILGEHSKALLERVADTGWLENSRTFATADKFLRRVEENPLFDYEQTLRGRESNLLELNSFLQDPHMVIAVLPGRGGIGKSKLIRDWLKQTVDWQILFKKETAPVNLATEQELSDDHYLVIVDDAHRQSDIDDLLQLARDLKRNGKTIKVLLSCRPIGVDRIKAALSRSFDPTAVTWLTELKKLSDADVLALAEEILGPDYAQYASYLTAMSRDTPLVTVIGGRLLRRNSIPLHALPNAADFQRAVFDKFLDDVEMATKKSPKNVRPLLHLASALQPLVLRRDNMPERLADFLHWEPYEVSQSVDALEASGLLIRSGQKYRIAPDMFADFLLEQATVDKAGSNTGYADAVYRSFGDRYLSNLLQNLAELDFRNKDQGLQSPLTLVWEDILTKYGPLSNYEKIQLLKSVESAAFYQPAPVMELVRMSMQPGLETSQASATDFDYFNPSQQDLLRALPALLGAIAYHPAYREEAVRKLWLLAKQDSRAPNAHPEHAFRVLKKLAGYSRYKSVEMNLDMARIAGLLCLEADAFDGERTPLDVVDVLLAREGEEQESSGRTITLSRFGIKYDAVAAVRDVCLKTAKECLYSKSDPKAVRGFRSFSNLLHGFLPLHPLSEEETRWHSEERHKCIAIIAERLGAVDLSLPLAQQMKADFERLIGLGHNEEISHRIHHLQSMLPLTVNLVAFDEFCRGQWDIREAAATTEDIEAATSRNVLRAGASVAEFRKQFSDVDECISTLATFFVQARECHISPNGANEFTTSARKLLSYFAWQSNCAVGHTPKIFQQPPRS